jgi:hypothetical protein
MNKFLIILGCIFSGILVTVVGLFVYGSIVGPKLDRESKAWVDTVLPEIIATWDVNVIINNSSSELLKLSPRKNFEKLFTALYAELGQLREYKGAAGESWIHVNNGVKTITMKYLAEAVFTKGSAQIAIQGIKEADGWKLLSFYVTPHTERYP